MNAKQPTLEALERAVGKTSLPEQAAAIKQIQMIPAFERPTQSLQHKAILQQVQVVALAVEGDQVTEPFTRFDQLDQAFQQGLLRLVVG